MKIAALVTLLVAAVLFGAMATVQNRLDLKPYRLGANPTYTEATLTKLIAENRSKANLVVVPLLFPIDFLFLLFFGVGLALCSVTHADALHVPRAWIGILLVLPIAYMAADFTENVLYSAMLIWPETIPHLIDAERWATRLKWLFVIPAM